MPGPTLGLGHDSFLPHPFQFTTHYHRMIAWCMVYVTGSRDNKATGAFLKFFSLYFLPIIVSFDVLAVPTDS
jgi:hypothetical protein